MRGGSERVSSATVSPLPGLSRLGSRDHPAGDDGLAVPLCFSLVETFGG